VVIYGKLPEIYHG